MIHRVEVDEETAPEELKKLFRKRLMTGGAVIRLRSGINFTGQEKLLARYLPLVQPNNIGSLVLRELAKERPLSPKVEEALRGLGYSLIQKELD